MPEFSHELHRADATDHEHQPDDQTSHLLAQLGVASIEGLTLAIEPVSNPFSDMEKHLNQAVIGQERAIESVMTVLKREALRDPNKPYASLLFLGPTGVGKTETARELNKILHGEDHPITRIDCSDYQQSHQVASLVGSPPGYVGREQTPKLAPVNVEGDKRIILFDEIEKASPALYMLLLQILEEGELSMQNEGTGDIMTLLQEAGSRPTNFRNSIIIMTSNLGAKGMQEALRNSSPGFKSTNGQTEKPSEQYIQSIVSKEVSNVLPPEFIGRIDQQVVFNPLDDSQLAEVVKRHTDKRNTGINNEGFRLHLSDMLIKKLIEDDPERVLYGGRRIIKTFERVIMSRLSEYVTAGSIPRGSNVHAVLDTKDTSESISLKFLHSPDEDLLERYEAAHQEELLPKPTSPFSAELVAIPKESFKIPVNFKPRKPQN